MLVTVAWKLLPGAPDTRIERHLDAAGRHGERAVGRAGHGGSLVDVAVTVKG